MKMLSKLSIAVAGLAMFAGTASAEMIQVKGSDVTKTFTVRKMSGSIGVERIFPLFSPFIDLIEVNKKGRVRRAKLYYLRALTGKKARIKEKRNKGDRSTV